jgi:hypothetical protein
MDFRLYHTAYGGYNSLFYEHTLVPCKLEEDARCGGKGCLQAQSCVGEFEMRDGKCEKTCTLDLEILHRLMYARCVGKL